MTDRIRQSSGNVFADLGFPRQEAAHLLVRSDLMIQLRRTIERRGMTQKAAAKALGVTQPCISDLMRGRIERFSIDTLVDMLAQLGLEVSFRVTRRAGRTAA